MRGLTLNPFWDLSTPIAQRHPYTLTLSQSLLGFISKLKTSRSGNHGELSIPFGIYLGGLTLGLGFGLGLLSIPFGIYHALIISALLSALNNLASQSLLGFIPMASHIRHMGVWALNPFWDLSSGREASNAG